MGLRFKALAFMQGFPAEDELRLPHWLASLPPELLASLFLDPLSEGSTPKGGRSLFSIYEEPIAPARAGTDIQKSLQFYQQVFLPEFVCMHTDRGAMLNSLEVRSPFLSPDIIEFANGLPDHFKVRGNTLKWILRKLASRRGYSRQITKQAKQGFTFPVARWIKGPLRSTIERLLFDESWRDDRLIDTSELKRIWEQHLSGSANNYRIIYNLAVFRAWRNRYKGLGT